ncbi:MAG: hypothetical protein J1E78_03910 [Muribaculaceae bacterium]|nr:hypothetical protein [Muribaculaceae bacterium]
MKTADIISVNPGKETLGQTTSKSESIFRSSVLNKNYDSKKLSLSALLFPTIGSGSLEFRKYSVPLRTVFATILILTGLASVSTATGICSLIFGGMLAMGLLTRPIMAAAAAFYAIMSALSIRAGISDITSLSLMFGCMVFCILGSGKYSCDYLLRHFLKHYQIKKEKIRREKALTYKAFRYAKF